MPEQRSSITGGVYCQDGREGVRANFWSTTGAASTQTCNNASEANSWILKMKARDGKSS